MSEQNTPVVIVTGASRGLGAAVAQHLVRFGACVVLNARSAGDLKVVSDELRSNGGQVSYSDQPPIQESGAT